MMNDRIKELVKKCGGVNLDEDGNVLTHFLVGHQIEKFAELIVRECLETIEEMDPHSAMRDIDDIYVTVEKHFGVNE